MTNHTPGPWTTDATWNGKRCVANQETQTVICLPMSGNAADANLIAAAPKLLAALKAILAAKDHGHAALWHAAESCRDLVAEAEFDN